MANVDATLAGKILTQSLQQLSASRRNKRQRFEEIKENENLYLGVIEKSIRNPFNECFPFMAGYVDHLKANIEDDSMLSFTHDAEADYKKAQKIQGMYDRTAKSPLPNDSWGLKHRYAKMNALFSGRAIYKYFADSDPAYCSYLKAISHWDFHNEPRGGGQLENHLFCGEDSIFRQAEELKLGTQYDTAQVAKLLTSAEQNGWKDSRDWEADRNNRAKALGQNPESNNYVGQYVVKLVDWFTTYAGKRYYVLFNEAASTWIRCEPLTDLFPDGYWPYASWATNEDPDVFWSKAPADDARPIAHIVNQMINQELYNREKRNYGQRAYDPEMFPNVAALANWRPDGLVPFDSKGGQRQVAQGLYEFTVGDLTGTLDLVTWLDSYAGRKLGNTASVEGDAAPTKQATVFMGELQQTDKLIGIKNKSYFDCLSWLGLLFKQGLEHNLTTEIAVKVMGGKGAEWVQLTPADTKTESPLIIIPSGGASEQALERAKNQAKLGTLELLQVVNPEWKERQMLLASGFDEADVKDAFSQDSYADRELLSEAAEAERQIVQGEKPKLNRGATAAFMQHIIDFATNTDGLSQKTYKALMDYATAHAEIAAENMMRSAREMIAARAKQFLSTGTNPPAGSMPTPGGMMPTNGGGPTPTGGAPGQTRLAPTPVPQPGFAGVPSGPGA